MPSGDLSLLLWLGLVIAGIGAMQWGAARVAATLGGYRGRLGLPGTVAGALLGIATAAPEISVNVASVVFGWPDLGLGAALGSNVPALPLVILLSYLSLRTAPATGRRQAPAEESPPPSAALVRPQAVEVQALPYLLVVLLLAALTLPPGWAGLQPIDGLLLTAAWGVWFAHALLRRRKAAPEPEAAEAAVAEEGPGLGGALLGVPAIALGALTSVMAARRLVDAFGASDLVGGLFVIGLLCALPESFAAWGLARQGKTTTAVSGAMADGIVSLTVALLPPALVGAVVGNAAIYLVNLACLAFALLAYIALNHARRGQELGPGRVALFVGGYLVYLAATVWLLARAPAAATA